MKLKYIYGMMLIGGALALASCSDDEDFKTLQSVYYPGKVELSIPAEFQKLIYTDENGASTLPLIAGESVSLACTVLPDDATSKNVKWTSSNPEVATVDQDGNIKAVSGDGLGYTMIQVAPDPSHSAAGISSTIKVAVSNTLKAATEISLTSDKDEVYVGETLKFSAQILPADATYRTVDWSTSDPAVATIDANGVLTGVENNAILSKVTVTATAIDGSGITASKEISVRKIVTPEKVTIDQQFSKNSGYLCAINEKSVSLKFTTVPEECTLSLITWTSSNEDIATVENGVVKFNTAGNFGDFTITATCPDGSSHSIDMSMPAGLLRELFHNPDHYSWSNAKQSGNGTSSSHVWHDGYLTVTTYAQNATKQRADFRSWDAKTWLHAGEYPIFAIRMNDLKDDLTEVTARNITLDASGNCNGTKYAGGLDGNNNKWLHDYKCSDGSHVFIYDLSTQKWATGGTLPTTSVAEFSTLQFKYADIAPLSTQVTYNVYWVQTFKSIEDMNKYITDVEGLTFQQIK